MSVLLTVNIVSHNPARSSSEHDQFVCKWCKCVTIVTAIY